MWATVFSKRKIATRDTDKFFFQILKTSEHFARQSLRESQESPAKINNNVKIAKKKNTGILLNRNK